jgi:two-component system sensor histidine kinase YesM
VYHSAGKMLKFRSIRYKLLVSFVAVMLLPLATLGIIGPLISAKVIEQETTASMEQVISHVARNTDLYIRQLEALISIIAQNDSINAFFDTAQGVPSPDIEARAKRFLHTVTIANPEIAGILVVNTADRSLSNEIRPIARDPLLFEFWYRVAVQDPSSVHLLPRPIGRNLANSLEYSPDDVVSIVKAAVDGSTGLFRGVILIDMEIKVVEDIFLETTLGKGGFLFIEDSSGEIVYAPPGNPVVYRMRNEWLSTSNTSVVERIRGENYQIISQDSQYTKWKTVGVFPMNEIFRQVDMVRWYSLIIAGVTLILAFMVSIFFSTSIARPVIHLETLMKKAEAGNLAVRFEGGGEDEIGHLGKSFNAMIDEIQKLIDMVYREQQSKREAELKTLHEQIKPHFLYNTLDTIQWMAQDHNADDIVKIVTALTRLFRIALSKGKELIPVREELDHVESYLIIQKARYEDKFDYTIQADPSVLQRMVLKLTLQPLVENAIYHGIKEMEGNGSLSVYVSARDGALVLSVSDNGVGMSPEKLEGVRQLLSNGQQKPSTGYGIYNVNERIRLAFGRQYGLQYRSDLGRGTTVEILHPIIEPEE